MAARKTPNDKFKAAVEKQAGACRSLAMALQADAKARGSILDRHDKKLIEGWAEIIAGIADALTAASVAADKNAAGRFSKAAAHLAIPLAAVGTFGAGLAEGAGQQFYAETFGDGTKVAECAGEIVQNDKVLTVIISAPIRSRGAEEPQEQTKAPPRPRKNIRANELAKELGMTNAELLQLAVTLGVQVKSPSSAIISAQADRMRKRAHRDGLVRPEQPKKNKPTTYRVDQTPRSGSS